MSRSDQNADPVRAFGDINTPTTGRRMGSGQAHDHGQRAIQMGAGGISMDKGWGFPPAGGDIKGGHRRSQALSAQQQHLRLGACWDFFIDVDRTDAPSRGPDAVFHGRRASKTSTSPSPSPARRPVNMLAWWARRRRPLSAPPRSARSSSLTGTVPHQLQQFMSNFPDEFRAAVNYCPLPSRTGNWQRMV